MPPKISDQSSGISPVVILCIVFFIFFVLGGGYWYTNRTPEPTQNSNSNSSSSSINNNNSSNNNSSNSSNNNNSSNSSSVPTCAVGQELVNGTCLIKCADGKIRVGIGCNDDPNAKAARRFPIPPKGAIEFGGMYGTEDDHTNPATKGKTCPSKFTPSYILGTAGKDYDLTVCTRKILDYEKWIPSDGSLEFGGMYTGNGVYKNPLAGSKSGCPTGFESQQVLGFGTESGGGAMDHGLHLCYRKIADNAAWEPNDSSVIFGGIMGDGDSKYPNPSTGLLTCPDGFTQHVTYGKTGFDNPISYCIKHYEYPN